MAGASGGSIEDEAGGSDGDDAGGPAAGCDSLGEEESAGNDGDDAGGSVVGCGPLTSAGTEPAGTSAGSSAPTAGKARNTKNPPAKTARSPAARLLNIGFERCRCFGRENRVTAIIASTKVLSRLSRCRHCPMS